jgi:hypothetical protein
MYENVDTVLIFCTQNFYINYQKTVLKVDLVQSFDILNTKINLWLNKKHQIQDNWIEVNKILGTVYPRYSGPLLSVKLITLKF